MAFFEVIKDFGGDVSKEIRDIRMPYADRLEKELLDISRTPRILCVSTYARVCVL